MAITRFVNSIRPSLCAFAGALLPLFAAGSALAVDRLPQPNPEQQKFFESKVRPVLEENCVSCHGATKQKGGLRLDSAAGVLKGGKEGAILVPGKPDESPLVTAVRYQDADLQMPPDNQLAAEQIQALSDWVRMGAPWPETMIIAGSGPLKGKHRIISDDDRSFWSFQPVKAVTPPALAEADAPIRAWCRNPVDRFIAAKLVSEGLTPATEADRATLIRRLTFDLHGLPPTPAEVAAFVADTSPTAYEDLVDRLLASPRYGEHWARHWLDLVRYAESDGYKQDAYRSTAWHFRDYVIQSLNDDKPYDRFVTEQLAGDEIAPNDPNVIVATGYLRHGTYEYNNRDVQKQWSSIIDDITDVTADAFLGMSMGCARCHDHKFDPILQADYFRLRAFFVPVLPRNDLELATPAEKADYAKSLAAWEKRAAPIRAKMVPFEKASGNRRTAAIKKFPEEMQTILFKPADQRTPLEEQLAQLAMRQVTDGTESYKPKLTGADKVAYDALRKELSELEVEKPKPLPVALIATDVGPVAPPSFIPGDAAHPLDPGYLTVLDKLPLKVPTTAPSATSTGRRTALAQWITQPSNPLTSRVIVNRLWQFHLGRGLVGTSSDFGRLGARPTHPELLDYLAKQFVDDGWSFKKMHRLILTSATYRQTALRPMPQVARLRDPENRWLWRMNSRRLDAEQVRDAMLMASGELLPRGAGPSAEQSAPVRSVYTKVLRNTRDALLDAFDLPESFGSIAERNVTTTASQALLMINGDWPLKRADAFAGRLYQQATGSDSAALVEAAYRIAYGRAPRPEETKTAVAFLARERQQQGPAVAAKAPAGEVTEAPITQTMPQRGGQAVLVRNANPSDMLRLPEPCTLGAGDFTVEAFVQLESIYDDGKVRVIASEWDGDQKHAGWAFGVTSERSKYQPRNLILQMVNEAGAYEVVVSDLRIEPHKAYFLGASVKAGQGGGVTFYLKDLTDMDAGLRSVHVPRKASGSCASKSPLTIGGRLGASGSQGVQGWDGLIDEVRISNTALSTNDLLYNDGDPGEAVCGHWLLKERPGFFKDSSGRQKDLRRAATLPAAKGGGKHGTPGSIDSALMDFCHVLLNSNEFLYVD